MASYLDQPSVFEARAKQIGLEETALVVLRSKNWNTFGNFAFASFYKPGDPDESKFLKLAATVYETGSEDPPEELGEGR